MHNETSEKFNSLLNSAALNENDLKEFLDSIKNDSEKVKGILENTTPTYDNTSYKNAKKILAYFKGNERLRGIYSERMKVLKKEFADQIVKLNSSKAYDFWYRLKNYIFEKYGKNINISKITNDIAKYDNKLPGLFSEVFFNVSDCSPIILCWFRQFFDEVFMYGTYETLNGINMSSKVERLHRYLKVSCFEKFFPKNVAEGELNDIGKASDEYFEKNKIILEELIEKLNKVIDLVAGLEFNDII